MLTFLNTRRMLALLPLRQISWFGQSGKPYWSQSNIIFKDYYSRRLTIETRQLQSFLIRLAQHSFIQTDHRWISLVQNIQTRLSKFNNFSKVYMLKALVNIGYKTQLFQKLYQSLQNQIQKLSFEQAGVLLWCIAKSSKKNQIQDVYLIYQRMLNIIHEEGEQPDGIRIIVSSQQLSDNKQKAMYIKPLILSMVLSSIASLKITQKKLIKLLLKNGVKDNIKVFTTTALVTLMMSYQKMGMRNKRDTMLLYNQLRSNLPQLQAQSIETLQNIALCVANLCLRQYSKEQIQKMQKYKDQLEKQQEIREDMKKFVLWICQTMLLRQKQLKKQTAAKILFYASKARAFNSGVWKNTASILTNKIQDCKIIDLVMAIKALSSLPKEQRNQLEKEEEALSNRLWMLQSSLAGKSLDIVIYLFKNKKIRPPSKISKWLNQIIMQEQTDKHKQQRVKYPPKQQQQFNN